MKLLIITNNPERASFRQRVSVYLGILRANGIDCRVQRLAKGFLARRRLFRLAREYDAVFVHKKLLNCFDAFELRRYSKKLIYNYDDAVMYSDKNPNRYSRSHMVPFRRIVKLADSVIVGSDYLADRARGLNSNVHVLPIGLNVDDYNCSSSKSDDGKIRLVWIGSKSTLDYLRAIQPVLEQIGTEHDNVVLRIIGDDFMDLKTMPVEKHTWAKETRGPDIAQCDIGLGPLPDDPFTQGKCSFKVLEYSAASLPVIASPVGTNSQYVCQDVTGFLVQNPVQWYDCITRLINDNALRETMGRQGQIHARQFDTKVIGRQFVELLKECL